MDSCLERLLNAITSATRGMTVEELTRHPEGKWSSAQILEHLYLTYTGTAKGFERCCEAGKPLASSLRLKDRKSTRLNSSHTVISYAVFCLKKKKKEKIREEIRSTQEDTNEKIESKGRR